MYKIEKGKLTIGLPNKQPACAIEMVDGKLTGSVVGMEAYRLRNRIRGSMVYQHLLNRANINDIQTVEVL